MSTSLCESSDGSLPPGAGQLPTIAAIGSSRVPSGWRHVSVDGKRREVTELVRAREQIEVRRPHERVRRRVAHGELAHPRRPHVGGLHLGERDAEQLLIDVEHRARRRARPGSTGAPRWIHRVARAAQLVRVVREVPDGDRDGRGDPARRAVPSSASSRRALVSSPSSICLMNSDRALRRLRDLDVELVGGPRGKAEQVRQRSRAAPPPGASRSMFASPPRRWNAVSSAGARRTTVVAHEQARCALVHAE